MRCPGSLPAFVEAGRNFNSERIRTDNLLQQVVGAGKLVAVLGDDTWSQLFPPSTFAYSLHLPSFDVFDLDTVDDGVWEALPALLQPLGQGGHDLTIAHFLGVDHAGHRYGPNHPEMARKLSQMDAVILQVLQDMPTGATLLVFGDHGMSPSGDHGGSSAPEAQSALFAAARTSAQPCKHSPSQSPDTRIICRAT
eukprot:gene5132-5217_t